MQIKEICKPIQDKLYHKLLEWIPSGDQPLYNAARYILEGGGKRVRPLLVVMACQDLGGDLEQAYDAACALEMIHNYSLIHDDLPCMDDDDMRRGKPTVHKAFSESTAVLAGDFLLTQAFVVLSQSASISCDQKLKLISLLSYYSGGEELLMGQSLDLASTNRPGTFNDLYAIYKRKTASLFSCALEFGAVLAQRGAEEQKVLREVGQKIGFAFQIQNDFSGKKKDQSQHKFTILSLLTEQNAKLLMEKEIQEGIQLLKALPQECNSLKTFCKEVLF